ncbi:MAG: aldo/keto reductase [Methanobacteriota archaeon]|nr:MAG: aldo/keto reductase [Euryarchaeota archaeon]
MSSHISLDTCITLNNGVKIPIFGLGTYKAKSGGETERAVLSALEVGYHHIDTAAIYGNEEDVGKALHKSEVPREEIFVTTKLWNRDHGYESALNAFEKSLKRLKLDYVDLYLIHWPVEELRLETWKALEKIYKEGKARAIGVSNYMQWHLDELLPVAEFVPAVNQIEFSPYLYQKDLQQFCEERGIKIEAYSPLTKGKKLDDPRLKQIAQKYNKTTAQILLRWAVQKGTIVLAKSSKYERILENASIFDFEISQQDMKTLDQFDEGLRTGWDPSTQKLWKDSR